MTAFLFWLYLTPEGQICFTGFIAVTAAMLIAEYRQPRRRAPTFDDELALLRRDLRVVRDPRNN